MATDNVSFDAVNATAALYSCTALELSKLKTALTAQGTALSISQSTVTAATAYSNPSVVDPTYNFVELINFINCVDAADADATANKAILAKIAKTVQARLEALKPTFS